jgi:hypothetical protein
MATRLSKLLGGWGVRHTHEARGGSVEAAAEAPSPTASAQPSPAAAVEAPAQAEILERLQRSLTDKEARPRICLDLVAVGAPCLRVIERIALDPAVDFYVRRWALVVGARFGDLSFSRFLRVNFVDGRNKAALVAAHDGGDGAATEALGMLNKAVDLLNNPGIPRREIGS